MRQLAVAVAMTLLLASASAAQDAGTSGDATGPDESLAARKAYMDRLLEMDDSVAAHVELAKWCEANGLADRAQVHWQEALFRDPENPQAVRALALDRDAPAEAPEPAAGAEPAEPTDPAFLARQRALEDEVREIVWRLLVPTDEAKWAKGSERILRMRDPAAAEPIARLLGAGSVEQRTLSAEALGGIPGEEARRCLVRMILTEKSQSAYLAAVSALRSRADSIYVGPLLRALSGPKETRRRAAYALGELRSSASVPTLIQHLNVREPKILQAPRKEGSGGPSAYIAVGTVVTYVRDVEPVVSEGVVAWNPIIGAITVGAVMSIHNPVVTGRRIIIHIIGPEPAVREALRKITGEDFGYDQAAWRQWLLETRHEVPAGTAP